MSVYRQKERFEGVQWMGSDTPKEDVEWLKSLPDGPSNVKRVEFAGDKFKLETALTESVADPGDYIMFGNNRQPLVMPPNVFDRMYEEVEDD